jgi:hypothetical protein
MKTDGPAHAAAVTLAPPAALVTPEAAAGQCRAGVCWQQRQKRLGVSADLQA